ncbi:MAG: ABC transporter ATP-binding protein [Eubacteriales bacterium]|nr:ABC transporter ATP-binding protein [Eubacteriales bacterium]
MKNRHPETGVFSAVRTAVRTPRILSVGTVLCVAASIVSSLLPPLLLARVIDSLTAGLPLSFTAALLYFGSLALEGVLSSAQETLLVLFGQKMTHALRSEMSRKLTRLPAGTLAAQNPGEVAARFSGDVDTVEALFTSGIISMIADACRILSILAVIAVKNTGLALILLPVLPILTVFTRFVQKRMMSAQLENRRAVAAVSGQVPETLHNIRTIHALGLEEYMAKRYDRRIGESYTAVEKTNFYDALYSPVVLLLNAAVVGAVMLLSASGKPEILALFGMSVGTSVAVINYISRIFSPIESLGMEIQTIQSAMAGVKRIDAFLSQAERTLPEERATAARGDIVLSHVTFGYKSRPVLRDFSMTVKEGEQVTLIGRTGAGKSTVFRLLLGLYRPEAGSVTIGGVDVGKITDRERRSCIGCVEQHFSRVPGTVADQITLGDPRITQDHVCKAAELAGMDEAIRSLPDGYDTVCTDGMFSQGEWQLLSVARAAASDPAILLLDEITANLDAETEARVLGALRRASDGRTVLSVSHRIYEDLGGRTVEMKACADPGNADRVSPRSGEKATGMALR